MSLRTRSRVFSGDGFVRRFLGFGGRIFFFVVRFFGRVVVVTIVSLSVKKDHSESIHATAAIRYIRSSIESALLRF